MALLLGSRSFDPLMGGVGQNKTPASVGAEAGWILDFALAIGVALVVEGMDAHQRVLAGVFHKTYMPVHVEYVASTRYVIESAGTYGSRGK